MHLKTLRMKRSLFALSTIVLGSTCFISSSSAAPMQPTGSSISVFGQAKTSADESIVQLWQQQTALATSLESVGLIAHDDDDHEFCADKVIQQATRCLDRHET